jgi:hypothetical protein
MSRGLGHLAARVTDDPFFLGSALAGFARSEGLDADGLATLLGCPPETLPALSLCRRPSAESERFLTDIRTIAERFGIDEDALTTILRRADAIEALQGTTQGARLAAARDRNAPEDPT